MKEENKERFAFVDREPQGYSGELQPLRALDAANTAEKRKERGELIKNLGKQAVGFLEGMGRERRGMPKTKETKFQNSIIRWIHEGILENPFENGAAFQKFFREVINEVYKRADVDFNPEKTNQALQDCVIGIPPVLNAIKNIQIEHDAKTKQDPKRRMVIGLNDDLDASWGIDLAAIHYLQEEEEEELSIDEVEFIQVKKSEISPSEAEDIQKRHHEFFKKSALLREKQMTPSVQEKKKPNLRTIKDELAKEKEKGVSAEELVKEFGNFILNALTAETKGAFTDDAIAAFDTDGIGMYRLNMVFKLPEMKTFSVTFIHELGGGGENAEENINMLMRWAKRRTPTLQEQKQAVPTEDIVKKILPVKKYVSSIIAGGKTTKKIF